MKVGDTVKIKDSGECYSSWSEPLLKYKLPYNNSGSCKKGMIGQIVFRFNHDIQNIPIYVVEVGDKHYLLNSKGLEVIDSKDEMIGKSVRITYPGKCYLNYESWMAKYAEKYISYFVKGKKPKKGDTFNIVATGPHITYGHILYLVQNSSGVYIMEEEGFEMIDEPQIGDYVTFINPEKCYNSYAAWIDLYAPEKKDLFICGEKPKTIWGGCFISAKGNHESSGKMLYLIEVLCHPKNLVFIMEQEGFRVIGKKEGYSEEEDTKGDESMETIKHDSGSVYKKVFDHKYYAVFARNIYPTVKVLVYIKKTYKDCFSGKMKKYVFTSKSHSKLFSKYTTEYLTVTVSYANYPALLADIVYAMTKEDKNLEIDLPF